MDMKMLRAEFLRDVVLPCNWDVLITTYEIVNIEKSYLKRINWRYIASGSKNSKNITDIQYFFKVYELYQKFELSFKSLTRLIVWKMKILCSHRLWDYWGQLIGYYWLVPRSRIIFTSSGPCSIFYFRMFLLNPRHLIIGSIRNS